LRDNILNSVQYTEILLRRGRNYFKIFWAET
jgi:hypothetical protein